MGIYLWKNLAKKLDTDLWSELIQIPLAENNQDEIFYDP
jgi:hypothetical protein